MNHVLTSLLIQKVPIDRKVTLQAITHCDLRFMFYAMCFFILKFLMICFLLIYPLAVDAQSSDLFTVVWFDDVIDTTYSIAWGDYDGDGDLDLVVGNYYEANRLYRNDGGFFVEVPNALAAGDDYTYSVAWGDYDGDGDLDLAVGNDGGVNRLYHNDNGIFTEIAGALGTAAERTCSVIWGDYDSDGDLDLAVGNNGQANRLYRNDDGVFHEVIGALSTMTDSMAWGDYDGDGDLDLAVGIDGSKNRLYRNDDGIFHEIVGALGAEYDYTRSIAWGDYDGDLDLDLVVGNWAQVNRLYRNDGGMFIEVAGALGTVADFTESVIWGDYDSDGDLDLAVGNQGLNRLYRNDNGMFVEVIGTLGIATDHTYSMAWGDYDSDGDLDLFVGNSVQLNYLYRNDSGILIGDVETLDTLGNVKSIAWGDYDSDGDLDLAIGRHGVDLLYRNDSGSFVEATGALGTSTDNTYSVAWGDYDSDGDLDLAVGGQVSRLYRNDSESFVEVTGALGMAATSVAWGDYDSDGDLDLAMGRHGVILYRNDIGSFVEVTGTLGTSTDNTYSVAWGDYDGDSDLDLAVGNYAQWQDGQYVRGGAYLYRNDGGTFSEVIGALGKVTDPTSSVAWGDYDGDGDLDLVIGNSGDPAQVNRLYRNSGGTFNEVVGALGAVAEDTSSLAWGDYDGDGDLDLALGTYYGVNRLYRNDGGMFIEVTSTLMTVADGTSSVAWGDCNGDGDLDLAIGNYSRFNFLYHNGQQGRQMLVDDMFTLQVGGVYTSTANHYAAANILESLTIPITYTLFDPEGDPVGRIEAFYSPDGGGRWLPAVVATDTVTMHLATGPITHTSPLLEIGRTPTATLTTQFSATNVGDGNMFNITATNSNYVYITGFDVNIMNSGSATVVIYYKSGTYQGFETNPTAWTHLITRTVTSAGPNNPTPVDIGGLRIPAGQGYALYMYSPDSYLMSTSGENRYIDDNIQVDLGAGIVGLFGTAYSSYTWNGTIHYEYGPVTTSTLNFNTDGAVIDLEMYLTISHTQSSQLAAALYTPWPTPTGTTIQLFDGVGGDSHGFVNLTLSDWATRSITTVVGTAGVPISGTYRPAQPLSIFRDTPHNVPIALIVTDSVPGITGTLTTWGLRSIGRTYVYTWDTFASDFFGQSDNVVFRMVAYPQPATAAVTGTYKYYNSTPGPFQRPYASATTFPFRVRGTQVRVFSETVESGNEAAGALVYRWNENTGSTLMNNSAGVPFRTDQLGYLQGRGQIGLGDQLLAMLPVSSVMEYAGALTFDGLNDYAIKNPFNNAPITETTVALWISTTQTTNGTPFSYATTGADDTLRIANPGNVTFYRGGISVATGISVNDGLWHHLAVTWRSSDGQVLLYKDGAAVYTGALAPGTTIAPGGSLVLGQDQDSVGAGFQTAEAFQGTLDEVQVWNKNLTPAEILEAMYGWVEEDATGLAVVWAFDDPANPGADTSGNDNDLTLYGPTWNGDYLGGYTVYHTNGAPTVDGVDAFTVAQPDVQEIAVTAQHPLILFDLNLSLEWDAHNDSIYLEQLKADLKKASAYLYDFTNGQVALGKVTMHQNADYWASAHIAVQASNRLRPFASIGGLLLDVFTETVTIEGQDHTLTYGPGQIRMGATWNRYGDPAQSIGVDWPLILAHELSHYLLYQYDVYIGLNDKGLLIPVSTCDGSAMGDVYAIDNTEFISDTVHWTDWCSQTLAAKTLGRTEWETLRTWYPWLITPALANEGPSQMPFEFTTVEIVAPTQAQATIEDPTFYLDYEGGVVSSSEARAFLLRDADDAALPGADDFDYIYDLGSPIGGQNRVLARGARPGDRLCVFDNTRAQFGCEVIAAGDERLTLRHDTTWQPVIQLTPVNSTTFTLTVQLSDTVALKARVYPEFGSAFANTDLVYVPPLNGYTGTLQLDYPVMLGHVQVWADEGAPPAETNPRREAFVSFGIGGNPGIWWGSGGGIWRGSGGGIWRGSGGGIWRGSGGGSLRAGEAPMASPDGQMILYASDEITFAEGQFYTIQAMAGLPDVPPGRTVVGQGYNLVATEGTPITGSVSIQYMGSDALVAGVYDENDLDIYFWDGNTWVMLDTELSIYFNIASAECQGTGIYALMGSIKLPLYGPGWNLFAYPVRETQLVTQALLSISGYYTTVYGYEASDPNDPWRVYDVTVPEWLRPVVNDLTALEFGKGYWINVSQAITLYLSSSTMALEPTSLQATLPLPPATFYGVLNGTDDWTPTAGMHVTAWIDGNLCGQTTTHEVDGQVVYTVNVSAEGTGNGCGTPGKRVIFQVDGQAMAPSAPWGDHQLWLLTLRPAWRVYLPVIMKQWP